MSYGLISEMQLPVKVKATVVSSAGYVGVGIASFAENISFHEAAWFKATVAVLGIIVVCLSIWNIALDLRIKRKKLEEDNV